MKRFTKLLSVLLIVAMLFTLAACTTVPETPNVGDDIGNNGGENNGGAENETENKNEIARCNRFVELAVGVSPILFAPPSGAYNATTIEVARALNMKTILWSRDTIDWRDKDETLIYRRATKDIRGGEFVLMHPMKETASALADILRNYESCNLRAITVGENLQLGG